MDELIAFVTARLAEEEASAFGMIAALEGVADWVIREDGEFDYTVTAGQLATEDVADMWREDAAAWIARHDPAHVLREVAVKQRIVDDYRITVNAVRNVTGPEIDSRGYAAMRGGRDALKSCVTLLAAAWSDHPDYRQEWATQAVPPPPAASPPPPRSAPVASRQAPEA
jgi:hypothetical protein